MKLTRSPQSAAGAGAAVARAPVPLSAVYLVFLASGFAALLYQVAWQRALFTLFGTNIESVTLVITAFMAGLGLGSLAGGWASTRDVPLVPIFAAVELATGAYGFVSLDLFAAVGEGFVGPLWQTGLLAFALVLLPTLLMGSTLPLLVTHLVRRLGDVGRSVGVLYFVNTLGAAIGALAAGLLVLGWLGLSGSVQLAAAVNLAIALGVLALWWRGR